MADHLTTEIRSDDMLNYREEFILYGLRKLGHPVVEVNIADEQIEECIMDTTSYFQNRHMDGVDKMYLCLLYTSPSPRDATLSRMPSSA